MENRGWRRVERKRRVEGHKRKGQCVESQFNEFITYKVKNKTDTVESGA